MLQWQEVPIANGKLFEGARWLEDAGVFQWVDILAPSIHRWEPGALTVESRKLDLEFATVALPLDADRSIVASRDSLYDYHWRSDSLSLLASRSFAEDIRFNDGGIAPDGTVYIGTMSMAGRRDAGQLFKLAGAQLTPVLSGIGISNGLGWTASGEALYVDSVISRVHRVDLTQPNPQLRTFAELDNLEEPDGLVIAPDCQVYVASWRGGCLIRLDESGRRLANVPVPARFPTSVSIGGPGRNLILVTSARPEDEGTLTDRDGLVFVARI